MRQYILGYDQRAEAVPVNENRKLRISSFDLLEISHDVAAILRPSVDVSALTFRSSMSPEVESAHDKTRRRESVYNRGVSARVLADSMHERDDRPRFLRR